MSDRSPYRLISTDGNFVEKGVNKYENDTYVANVYPPQKSEFPCEIIHISFSRKDGGHAVDWRDKQHMKNQLVGTENEAVELFPCESRKVDGANQFHLFVLAKPRLQFPFGFTERLVADESRFPNLRQRKGSEATPEDIERNRKAEKEFLESPAGREFLRKMGKQSQDWRL